MKNTLIIIVLIFLVIYMHIGPTRLLENSASNATFDKDKRLCTRSIGLDWDDNTKIKEAIATDKNNKNEEKDP